MKRFLKRLIPLGIALLTLPVFLMMGDKSSRTSVQVIADRGETTSTSENTAPAANKIIQNAFDTRRSKLQVQGKAVVYRVLPDDLEGSRHQRFLLRLTTGLSLLIAHNIDLAPRINGIKVGDTVEFYGVYEWNEKGGVVHWTHHDPDRRHEGGWLKHGGRTFQ